MFSYRVSIPFIFTISDYCSQQENLLVMHPLCSMPQNSCRASDRICMVAWCRGNAFYWYQYSRSNRTPWL